MKKLHNTKLGLTLVEVVTAIVLASFLLGSFIMLLSSQYSSLNRVKFMTSDYFMAQKNVEEALGGIRVAFKTAEGTGSPVVLPPDTAFTTFAKTPLTVFAGRGDLPWPGSGGIKLEQMYTISSVINGAANTLTRPTSSDISQRKLYALVSDKNIPDLPTCEIIAMEVELLNGTAPITTHYAYSPDSLTLNQKSGSLRMDIPVGLSLQTINYNWYQSTLGFNTVAYSRMSDMPTDRERSLYPLYKANFEIVRSALGTTITVTPDMAGRTLALVGSPAAVNGKIGKEFASNYVYIMGLPVLDGSILHLDAGTVQPGVDTDIDPTTKESLTVKHWRDCAPGRTITFTPDDAASPPIHDVVQSGKIIDTTSDILGNVNIQRAVSTRAISFNGAKSMTSAEDIDAAAGEFSVFVVARSINAKAEDQLLEWGDLELSFEGVGEDENFATAPDLAKYNLLGCLQSTGATPDTLAQGLYTFINQEEPEAYPDVALAPSGQVVLAPDDEEVEILEVIFYDRALTEDELKDVREYLMKKYGLGV